MSEKTSLILTARDYKEKLDNRNRIQLPTRESGNLTLPQFFELMTRTLSITNPGVIVAPAWPNYLIAGSAECKETMNNPTENFVDTITYLITREEPGSQSSQPFGTKREVAPRIREVKEGINKGKIIYGQWFDTLVQFDVWSLTNYEVDNLSVWFKRFMTVYRDFFKHFGLSEMLFWWRGRDESSARLNNSLHVRTLVYFVRTEEISEEDFENLKKLEIEIQTKM